MESTLLVVPACYVYKIPPMRSAAGHRAADWDVQNPIFSGSLRVIAKGEQCVVKIVDSDSGELFALCAVSDGAVEPVSDSSRYFVLKIENQGRHAFVGLGFSERSQSFDFNVALQDHKKRKQQDAELKKASAKLAKQADVDYSLKAPITVKINVKKKGGKKKAAAGGDDGGGGGLGAFLPPPPKAGGSVKKPSAAGSAATAPAKSATAAAGGGGGGGGGGGADAFGFGDFDFSAAAAAPATPAGGGAPATAAAGGGGGGADPFAGWSGFGDSGSGGGGGGGSAAGGGSGAGGGDWVAF